MEATTATLDHRNEEGSQLRARRDKFVVRSEGVGAGATTTTLGGASSQSDSSGDPDTPEARKKGSYSKADAFEWRSFPNGERPDENLWDRLHPILILVLFGSLLGRIKDEASTTEDVVIETPFCTKKKLRWNNLQQEGSPVPSLVEESGTDSSNSSHDTYNNELPILPFLSQIPVLLTESGNDNSNDDDTLDVEAEDKFRVLPVRFRSRTELTGDKEEKVEADATMLAYQATEGEMRARDLCHAEEIARHARELEAVHRVVAELRESHRVELESLKRNFHEERKQREHLLEQALSYAEELEAAKCRESREHSFQLKKLHEELREREATIERLRIEERKQVDELLQLAKLNRVKLQQFKLNQIKTSSW